MTHARDIAGIEGHALGRRLWAYWMTDVVGEDKLWGWGWVVCWEMAAGGKRTW